MAWESLPHFFVCRKTTHLIGKETEAALPLCAIWQQPTTESTVEPGSNKNKGTMTKGYADYVIAMALEIDREIKRELEGVEMPPSDRSTKNGSKHKASPKAPGKLHALAA